MPKNGTSCGVSKSRTMREHGVSSSIVACPRTMPRVPTGGGEIRTGIVAVGFLGCQIAQWDKAPLPMLIEPNSYPVWAPRQFAEATRANLVDRVPRRIARRTDDKNS